MWYAHTRRHLYKATHSHTDRQIDLIVTHLYQYTHTHVHTHALTAWDHYPPLFLPPPPSLTHSQHGTTTRPSSSLHLPHSRTHSMGPLPAPLPPSTSLTHALTAWDHYHIALWTQLLCTFIISKHYKRYSYNTHARRPFAPAKTQVYVHATVFIYSFHYDTERIKDASLVSLSIQCNY